MTILYDSNRGCTACPLSEGCKGPVPAVGLETSKVMLIGEAPGRNEDIKGEPFTGDAGQYLDSLLDSVGIRRSDVLISNVVKCRPRGNRTPTVEEAEFCATRWLDVEVEMFQPEIIVPMGRVAIQHFLGDVTVEHVHGIPAGKVLPVYHPAAGFYDTRLMRAIQEDFQALGKLVNGETQSAPVDQHPDPDYVEYENITGKSFSSGDRPMMAYDTEVVDNKLWSVQASGITGTAGFFPGMDQPGISGKAVVHNYLYDAQWIDLPDSTDDTMLMAYLLGLPQGLKELAWRLCGMEMQSYQEIMGDHRRRKGLLYLSEAAKHDWPDPPDLTDVIWIKKDGRLGSVTKKPQHISRKIKRIIADVVGGKENKDGPVNPWTRWHNIDPRERAAVEKQLGKMPDASLEDVDPDTAIRYSCRDADATLRVYQVLWPKIQELGLEFTYQLDRQVLPVAMSMMQEGIALDGEFLGILGRHYMELMEAKAEDIFSLVGKRFNPNSDNELRVLMYEYLGFKPTKFTETGLPKVNKEELSKLKHAVVPMLLEYKHLAHLKDSFCDTLPGKIDSHGRVHCTINVTRTETGRWSMKEPNLQQIPARTEYGREIRKAFVAGPGYYLAAIDYSQIEMRVAAHLAQCQSMIGLFNEGRDIHTETAAQIFNVPLDQVTSQQRYPTKTMGFGVIYGLTPHGLYSQMAQEGLKDWTEDRCQEFIDEYYALRPELGTWQEVVKKEARQQGYVRDLFGRIRYIPELLCPIKRYQGAGERQAINMPVQSTAQGILKLATGRLWKKLEGWPPGMVNWLLQIHDELLWEVEAKGEVLDTFTQVAVKEMEAVVKLSVPVIAECKVGDNWGEMKPFTVLRRA